MFAWYATRSATRRMKPTSSTPASRAARAASPAVNTVRVAQPSRASSSTTMPDDSASSSTIRAKGLLMAGPRSRQAYLARLAGLASAMASSSAAIALGRSLCIWDWAMPMDRCISMGILLT